MSLQKPWSRPSSPRKRSVVFVVALAALLFGVGSAQSQVANWDGTVEVDTRTLRIEEGQLTSYRVRLNGPMPAAFSDPNDPDYNDKWWVMIWVDGQKRPDVHQDGGYNGLIWTPSLGWEFGRNNWGEWRKVTINVKEGARALGASGVVFRHEVWDHNSNCPVHNASPVTVNLIGDEVAPPPPPPPSPPPPPEDDNWPDVSIGEGMAEEGETVEFEVRLSRESEQPATVTYATMDGTAEAGADYDQATGTLTFEAGTTVQVVRVQTTEDQVEEPTESFTVELGTAEGAQIPEGAGTGQGTITDDDSPPPPPPPEVSIGDATVEEGDKGEFEVRLSEASAGTVTVAYATVDGTAVSATDYTALTGTLTFEAGTTVQVVEVQTTEDTTEEPTEGFTVELGTAAGATVDDGTGLGTITDDDAAAPVVGTPSLSIGDATVEEGETAEFEVRLSEASTGTVTVTYATMDGTAEAGADYDQATGTLTFEAGTTVQVVEVQTMEDTTEEPTEGFTVELSSPSGATVGVGAGQGTITDDDAAAPVVGTPSLSIEDATVEEGDKAEFEVRLSEVSTGTVTVAYATVDGTAEAGTDYDQATGTLTFEAGTTVQVVEVQTMEDTTEEPTEAFTVKLSSPSGATLGVDTGLGTITDDDAAAPVVGTPSLSIGDATVEEGETAEFEVRLSEVSTGTVTVTYETMDGTAVSATDYTAVTGTLTFEAGTTVQVVEVQTTEDTTEEPTEAFRVELSSPSGATVGVGAGQGTITDDDAAGPVVGMPSLSIGDATVEEGDKGEFEVRLSEVSTGTVTVTYATMDGTAEAGTDYDQATGTLTFEAGTTVQVVEVQTMEDTTEEPTEAFTVKLSSPSGATVGVDTGLGTITDDDGGTEPPVLLPSLSIGDATVEEGETAEFEVRLSEVSTGTVTVTYETMDGTAVSATDYTAVTGTLTFEAGTTVQVVEVQTTEDTTEEPTEAFRVELSSPSGATVGVGAGQGTITDDDAAGPVVGMPSLSIGDATVEEGDKAEFEVRLSEVSTGTVTVTYATMDGTAEAGTDYDQATGTLTFEAGTTVQVVEVQTMEDTTEEPTEAFTVKLSSPSGATLGVDTGLGTITDDDGTTTTKDMLPKLLIADASVEEGGTAQLAVTLDKESSEAVTVSYRTVDGTAVAGLDYTATEGILSFKPRQRTQVIRVKTLEDTLNEPDEAFTVELSSPSGATLGDGTATATIRDDAEVPATLPRLDIADTTVGEGGTARFMVRLSSRSATPVTVSYRTVDGTAEAGTDYRAASGTLQFDAGTTTRTLSVETLTDERVEGDERFTVKLSNAVRATVGDGTGTGKITDDVDRVFDPINRVLLPEMGRALAFTSVRCRIDQAFSDLANGAAQPFAKLPASPTPASLGWTAAGSEPLRLAQALAGASFMVPSKNGVTVWGCGDYRSLAGDGKSQAVAWDGEVFSGQFGIEMRLDTSGLAGWAGSRSGVSFGTKGLAGFSISQSRASFDYGAGGGNPGLDSGRYDLELTGLHPYLGWSISPDVHLWTTVGVAWGKLGRTDDLIGDLRESSAKLDSGALGINARLLARGAMELNLKGEAALARLDVGGGGAAFGSGIDLGRLRMSLQASREYGFPAGGFLTPWGELGVRHDGGDGDTGAGVELGGGLRYRNSTTGWTAEGHGRWLATHAGGLERDAGFRALLRFAPGVGGRGPSVTLGSIWGDPASGVQRMWDRGASDSLFNDTTARSLEARLAYGFGALRGRGVLTPYGVMSLKRGNGRGYRLGLRWANGRLGTLNLEAERRERRAATDYGITARMAVGF